MIEFEKERTKAELELAISNCHLDPSQENREALAKALREFEQARPEEIEDED